MSAYVGIDVSKETLDVAIRQNDHSQHVQVPNQLEGFEVLHNRLQASGEIRVVALEASGRYGEALAHFLVEQGYVVNYLNPKLTHRFSQKSLRYSKTDAHDAASIAHYAQLHPSAAWLAPSPEQRLLQQRSRRLETLKKMRQQEVNRLKSGLDDPLSWSKFKA